MSRLSPEIAMPRARSLGKGSWRRRLADFDWPLFVAVGLLAFIGLLNLYSATHNTAHSAKFDLQVKWMVLGFVLYIGVTAVDYHATHRLAWLGLGGIMLMLLAVALFGDNAKGAARWLALGAVRIQPSELAKIVVIVALGRLLHDRGSGDLRLSDSLGLLVAILLPVLIIATQPDLGTASLLALIILSMSLLLARRVVEIGIGIGLGVAALPLLWEWMHDYQKARILAFLDPSADPTGSGWHAQQSILAVGSGQMTGKGLFNATQNAFNFLPEHWTDFPFSVWAEEWGFLGSLFVLVLFAFIIFRCVHIGLTARDRFGTAICIGVAAMVFWHMVVNIAMVLGLAPVVGVTLPLISYGGSSVLTFLIGFGLVSAVSLRRQSY